MPPSECHTVAEKQRVLDAYLSGRQDWLEVAASNGFAPSTASDLVARGRAVNLPRGGVKHYKMTEEANTYLNLYLNENWTYSLETLHTMHFLDSGVKVSTATISSHLMGMLYTETSACRAYNLQQRNQPENRQEFAKKLKGQGNCIVYDDETNFNVHLKRQKGRAKRGKRAVLKLPSSKGPNLQVECAVSSSVGLVTYRLQLGSIRMDKNAVFVDEIYTAVKESEEFRKYYEGKMVVVVMDNAPAHHQIEDHATQHADMELLRLDRTPQCATSSKDVSAS